MYCVSLCFNVGHANLLQFINRVFDTTPQFRREKFLENEDEMHFTERSQLPMCYSTICLGIEKKERKFQGNDSQACDHHRTLKDQQS